MTVRIEQLTPQELTDALEHRPIVYAPCGLVEWHGRHLPLGLDGLKIHRTLLGCAERTGGVVLPVNWFGAPGFGTFAGTMTYPDDLVESLLTALLGQCRKLGGRVIALVTGHYGPRQVGAVKRAAEAFAAEHDDVGVLARPEYENVTVDGQTPADHAGRWETSMALALFPEWVKLDRHGGAGQESIDRYGDEHAEFDDERRPWVWPEDLRSAASADLGRRAVEAIRAEICAAVERLATEKGV